MTYIVTQIEKGNELQELLSYFREIDKDKNGVIAKDELVAEFMKHKVWADNEAAEVEIEKILKYIDANMSGQVDFTEFVLATIEREKLLSEENVRNCFKMFDKVATGDAGRGRLSLARGAQRRDGGPGSRRRTLDDPSAAHGFEQ